MLSNKKILSRQYTTAAIACYSAGIVKGGTVFLALGLSFEAAFWYGLFSKKD